MGLIRRFVLNPVASNLLMVVILLSGLLATLWIPRELFPEFSVDMITVTVARPGATPEDVERGIVEKIEEEIEGLEGIDEISSSSREGVGTVAIELHAGADGQKVLDEVKTKVDQADLPDDAEDPTSVQVTLRTHVINLAVFGEAPERTLKELAEQIREEIEDLPEVTQVSVTGVRPYEITIEVDEATLRRYRLTMDDVSAAIRNTAFDLPAGDIETPAGEMTLRIVEQRYRAEEYRDIPILTRADGTILRLSDVARVSPGFEDIDTGGLYNGKPSALVTVFKTEDEDSIAIADAVRAYVVDKRAELPDGIDLETFDDRSKVIRDRLEMLVRNGLTGLVLVFLVLWTFLGGRLAFWVAMGIPVSVLGTILVLLGVDMTLNMMSMFALIMALGLIVDDAIVVGENIYAEVEEGKRPRIAAVEGTHSVLMPVIGAVITTWLAFGPLLGIPGVMGKFIQILPICVIVALGFSLVECLLILPAHLAHSLRNTLSRAERARRTSWAMRVRHRIDGALHGFIDRAFLPVFRVCVNHRYVVLAATIGAMLLVFGAFQGGLIRVNVFPKFEADTMQCQITLPPGTPMDEARRAARRVSLAARALNERLAGRGNAKGDGEPVQRVYAMLGGHMARRGPGEQGSHLAQVMVELSPSEQRTIRSTELVEMWRKESGPIPEALSVRFAVRMGGPGGAPFEIRLLGQNTRQCEAAAERLKERMASFDGVEDIDDDALPGKMEMKIALKDRGYSLGVNLRMVARQLRDAFYGSETMRVQRGRDEIKVMVRYPERRRQSVGDVEDFRIRTPSGAKVPFSEIAEVTYQRGFTTLRRVEGKSVVTVTADIDEKVANAEAILAQLGEEGFFAELQRDYPGLRVDLEGQRQQWNESLGSLQTTFPIALAGIYSILAIVFRSYVQPLIIMVAIPFGLIGAVVGHWLMGYDVTLLSLFGMVALTGIVVNDSLVLIAHINERIRSGEPVYASVAEGARRRFRPILLTTVTTVVGMGPILLEQSFQAQFLKPMVVSIAFGLSLATALTLVVVPSLYLVGYDITRLAVWTWTGRLPSPEDVAQRDDDLAAAAD